MDEYILDSSIEEVQSFNILNSSDSEVEGSNDFDTLVEQQENFHNDFIVMGYTFSCFLGVIVALIVVLIYSKGFQSNAK